jgi:hypothetical protein
MTVSMFIPSWRGWLALAFGFADVVALNSPALLPAYDAGYSVLRYSLTLFLVGTTAIACSYSFRKRRAADRVAAIITALLVSLLISVYVLAVYHRVL